MSDLPQVKEVLKKRAERGLKLPEILNGRIRVIDTDEIKGLFPHRGVFLLIDKVEVHGDRVVGFLEVIAERCPGFCHYSQDYLMFMGTLFAEMGIQTLGAACSLMPELSRKSIFVSGGTGVARFLTPVTAGQTIEMCILRKNIVVVKGIRKDHEKFDRYFLMARKLIATAGGSTVATIRSVAISSTPLSEDECLSRTEKKIRDRV